MSQKNQEQWSLFYQEIHFFYWESDHLLKKQSIVFIKSLGFSKASPLNITHWIQPKLQNEVSFKGGMEGEIEENQWEGVGGLLEIASKSLEFSIFFLIAIAPQSNYNVLEIMKGKIFIT